MRPFKITESDLLPGCRQILVEGELDLVVAERLQEAIRRAATDHERILVSLERCDFIDSTGIAVVVRAHNRLSDEGRRLAVYAPSRPVWRVLKITGLTANGLVFDSLDEALAGPPDDEPVEG